MRCMGMMAIGIELLRLVYDVINSDGNNTPTSHFHFNQIRLYTRTLGSPPVCPLGAVKSGKDGPCVEISVGKPPIAEFITCTQKGTFLFITHKHRLSTKWNGFFRPLFVHHYSGFVKLP